MEIFHRSSPMATEVVPTDPEDGYTVACNSVISAVEATGGHPDGTNFILTSMTDQSISIWNQRLGVVCRPSVSIISAVGAKTHGWVSSPRPILFGAFSIQKWRFRQWQTEHPPRRYINSETGDPVTAPLPDLSDAVDLLAAETHLTELKEAKAITQKELDGLQLNFVDGNSRKRLLIELKQEDVEAMELALLMKARDAGVPIDDCNLAAWAKNRLTGLKGTHL